MGYKVLDFLYYYLFFPLVSYLIEKFKNLLDPKLYQIHGDVR